MATVLVVDDDGGVRRLVELILQQKGHDVLLASNGLEGLMVYSSYRSRIDLVLTDFDMPQMNGLELADRIHARDPGKRILLMSGRPPQNPGCKEEPPIILKPFLPHQLIEAVEGILKT
jgi:two-component system, cell cycle sensor histidine kinase and response regulator CckA